MLDRGIKLGKLRCVEIEIRVIKSLNYLLINDSLELTNTEKVQIISNRNGRRNNRFKTVVVAMTMRIVAFAKPIAVFLCAELTNVQAMGG